MIETTYKDSLGRQFLVQVPYEGANPEYGIIIGPPLFDSLRLPTELEVRLHNELFNRHVFTLRDAKRRRPEIEAALKAALRLDVQLIMEVYNGSPA